MLETVAAFNVLGAGGENKCHVTPSQMLSEPDRRSFTVKPEQRETRLEQMMLGEATAMVAHSETSTPPVHTKLGGVADTLDMILDVAIATITQKESDASPVHPPIPTPTTPAPILPAIEVPSNDTMEIYAEESASAVYENEFEPVPRQFIPPIERPEDWYKQPISAEELDATLLGMALPLVFTREDLPAKSVPREWVEAVCGALAHMATSKYKPGAQTHDTLSPSFRNIFATFFVQVHNEDEERPRGEERPLGERLIGWRTVYYVAHLMRRLPTADCYVIRRDDCLNQAYDINDYELDDWTLRREHHIRLALIASITEDTLDAVYTLDLLMRFKRAQCGKLLCVATENSAQSLVFVRFREEDGAVRYAWIECGLSPDTVTRMLERGERGVTDYYDGPQCEACHRHHIALSFCTGCYDVQYCSKECQKKRWKAGHKETCERSARRGCQCGDEKCVNEHSYAQSQSKNVVKARAPWLK